MNRTELYRFHKYVTDEAYRIFTERNEDRAMDEDALSNLRGEAMMCGKAVDDHALDYVALKLFRVQHGHKQGTDIYDDLKDMINYIIIFMALKQKRAPKETP